MERNGYGRLFDKDCRLMLENVSPLPENENFLRNNNRFAFTKDIITTAAAEKPIPEKRCR